MKPVAFDYECPKTLSEACSLLASDDLLVKPLAGGQSLGPMLNMRLVQPEEVTECVWEAYHHDRLHWYVPADLEPPSAGADSPEEARDQQIAGRG